MNRKLSSTLCILFLALASRPVLSGSWWMAEGAKGTCLEAVGNMSWLSPDTLVKDYGCEITGEEHMVTTVDCKSGELKGSGYAFSKDEERCLLFAKMLQNSFMKSKEGNE